MNPVLAGGGEGCREGNPGCLSTAKLYQELTASVYRYMWLSVLNELGILKPPGGNADSIMFQLQN
jgi:hypothetical protein